MPERDALMCIRRPRGGTDRPHLFHVISGRGRAGVATEYETDRARFVGRGRRRRSAGGVVYHRPAVEHHRRRCSIRSSACDSRCAFRPAATARLAFTTGFAETEEGARQLIEKYHDRRAVARALALASTHSQIELRHLGLTLEDTLRFQRLAGRLMYGDPRLRAAIAVRMNTRGQHELWKYGISGDLPILLLRLEDEDGLGLFRDLLKAHEYLRRKGLVFDLVVLNEHASSYLQDLQNALIQIVGGRP